MKTSTFFIIIGLLCLGGMFYFHEQVHVEIYRHHGIDSHVEWFSHFPDAVTVADGSCETDSCHTGHAVNEAVSYVLAPFYIMVFFGILIIIGIMEDKE